MTLYHYSDGTVSCNPDKQKVLHREDGPAIEYSNGYYVWYKHGVQHRENGPSFYSGVCKSWWVNGKRHRLDGPAVEYFNGEKRWYQNGQLHRPDGPAVECVSGTKSWYRYGKRHRLDGPAVELANGTREYWIDGAKLTEEEFIKARILSMIGDSQDEQTSA